MQFKRLATVVAVLLVAGFAAIAVAVHFLDPRSLAPSLAASVKANTGRELKMGAVDVRLLPRPALVFSELRLANAPWGSQPWLLQAGRATAEFDVLALFSRRLRIKRIEVSDASVFLETDRSGGNWVMGTAGEGAPGWLTSLQIEGLELQSVAIAYRDNVTRKTISAQLEAARVDTDPARGTIRLSARGTYAAQGVELSGSVGSLAALIANAPAYPVDLEGKVAGAGVSLRGSIDEPRTLGLMKLALSVQTAHPAELAAVFGAKLPPLGDFRGSAQLIGPAAAPALLGIEAMLGGRGAPEIRASGVVANLRTGRGIDLTLAASAKQPWRLSTAASAPRLPPFRASGRLRDAQQGYRVDDMDLKIAGTAAGDLLQVVQGGQLAIKDGRLSASALQVTLGGARVTLEGSVADPRKPGGLDLGIALQGGDLAELFKFFGSSIRPAGPYQGRARMQGSLDALRLAAIDLQAGQPGQSLHASGQIEDVIAWRGVQLAVTASVGDVAAAGRLFGVELPRLPALRATGRIAEAPGGHAIDDLRLSLGRTSVQGRVALVRGEPRARVTADLSGPMVDLSELLPPRQKSGVNVPLPAADIDANIRFDRVVLRDRRALGPVSGGARLAGGVVEMKQFSAAIDGASAALDGRIGDVSTVAGLDLMVNVKIAHGRGLAAFTGHALKKLPAFTASGRLTDTPQGYAVAGLKLAHAATAISGELAVTRGEKRFKLGVKGNSPLLDATVLLQSPGPEGAATSNAATRAIPDLPLPLEILRAVDADLDLRFDALKLGESASLGPLTVRAELADGRFKADPVLLAGKEGQTINLSGTIDARQNGWMLRVQGTGIEFGVLLGRFGHAGVVSGGSSDLDVRLQGRGKSLAAIIASLNGDARLSIGPHRVQNFAINLKGGILPSLFALANPSQKSDPDTDVKCLAVSVPVRNGVIVSERGIALETSKYNLVVSGTVDLRSERIEMTVTPVVRREAGTIVRVSGTLASPQVGLDVAGAAKSTASLGIAVVAPAWLIADSLIKKAVSDPSPCATALTPNR